jgi:hypothetical protein
MCKVLYKKKRRYTFGCIWMQSRGKTHRNVLPPFQGRKRKGVTRRMALQMEQDTLVNECLVRFF